MWLLVVAVILAGLPFLALWTAAGMRPKEWDKEDDAE